MDVSTRATRMHRFLIIRRHAPWALLVLAALLLAGCAVLGATSGFSAAAITVIIALVLAGCGIPEVASETAKDKSVTAAKTVDLGSLAAGDGTMGFVFTGPYTGRAGTSVSMGDFNGDGLADVAIGAPHRTATKYGGAYIVFGGTAHGAVVDANTVTLPVASKIYGYYAYDYAGTSVAFLGNVNGDGLDDLAIGSPRGYPNTGSVGIVFGTATPPPVSTLSGTLLNGTFGTYLIGLYGPANAGEHVGGHIAFAGDLNGDGNDDFLIAAPQYNAGGGPTMGKVYEGFIPISSLSLPPITLSPAAANVATILSGPPAVNANLGGYALAGGGDVDGDGNLDVLIGMPGTFATYDHAFVHFNPGATAGLSGSFPSLTFPHFGFREVYAGDGTGDSGALADLDGDGLSDVIIASPYAHRKLGGYGYDDTYVGRVHVIFGTPALPTSMIETQLDGTNGFTLIGANHYEAMGTSVAVGGDINGDGHPDLLIVANDVTSYYVAHKVVYVIFGGPRPGVSEIHLSQLKASQGLILTGIPGYDAVVAGGRDMDGDGVPDLIIGSRYAYSSNGAAYIIFGKALR